jgi:ferredoxin-NADP reductase
MVSIRDILPIFRSSKMVLKETRHETGDIYTFILTSEEGITWKSGYHGMFWIDGKKVKGKSYRGFSLASHEDEKQIMVSTRLREPVSDFKKKLMEMKPGDKLKMRGPFGWFFFHDRTKPVLMIAGGIGITPFRSLLIDAYRKGAPKSTLLYSSPNGIYTYIKDLDNLDAGNSNIDIHYIRGREEVKIMIEEYVKEHRNNSEYFISGSMDLIKSTKKYHKQLGIKGKNIRNEPMLFY